MAPVTEALPIGLPLSVLERSKAVICALDSGLRIFYCNPAWDQFASENAGQGALAQRVLGSPLLDAIAGPLKSFYRRLFERAQNTGRVEEFDYECSSAEIFRSFHMRVLPLKETGGFLVVHSLRVEKPMDFRAPLPGEDKRYIGLSGMIVMCCHCRRTRRANDPQAWDWVPSYLSRRQPNVSHGLCPLCYAYFYPRHFQEAKPR